MECAPRGWSPDRGATARPSYSNVECRWRTWQSWWASRRWPHADKRTVERELHFSQVSRGFNQLSAHLCRVSDGADKNLGLGFVGDNVRRMATLDLAYVQ